MAARVHVIATTLEGTRAALGEAVPLAKGAGARLVVLVPQIASPENGSERDEESVAPFVKRYRAIVRRLNADADVLMCPCRSLDDLVAKICAEDSHVVVGGPVGRWLTSPEER